MKWMFLSAALLSAIFLSGGCGRRAPEVPANARMNYLLFPTADAPVRRAVLVSGMELNLAEVESCDEQGKCERLSRSSLTLTPPADYPELLEALNRMVAARSGSFSRIEFRPQDGVMVLTLHCRDGRILRFRYEVASDGTAK